jgi:hypothetical protein
MNLNIPNVVGRRWGARGGGRHGAFGGGGGYSYYASPWLASEEIVELSPGVPVRITREPRSIALLSGHGAGRRDRELADLGALITPGASGVTVQLSLDADHRLCASICIDGECYQGSVDLSPVLERIASGIASYHASLHGAAPSDVAADPHAVEVTTQAANAAVESAGDLLVGALIDQHSVTLSAGWWHSLTHAIYDVHHAVAKTVQKFKTPITIAATAVATAYGGPAGGQAAANLTGPIIDAVANDFKKSKDAKAIVDAAHAAAQTDPRVAKALADAHRAVADTAAAYHLTATAADAAGGDPAAARKLADLDQAATNGDAGAQRAMSIITQAFSAADNPNDGPATTMGGAPLVPFALGAAAGLGGYAWWRRHHARKAKRAADAIEHPEATPATPPTGPAPSSGPTTTAGELIGAAITTLRRAAQTAVMAAHERNGGAALGYVKHAHGASVLPFETLDDADDWFGALDPRHYLYAAYFDAADPTWPSPANEQLGGPAAASAHAHVSEASL